MGEAGWRMHGTSYFFAVVYESRIISKWSIFKNYCLLKIGSLNYINISLMSYWRFYGYVSNICIVPFLGRNWDWIHHRDVWRIRTGKTQICHTLAVTCQVSWGLCLIISARMSWFCYWQASVSMDQKALSLSSKNARGDLPWQGQWFRLWAPRRGTGSVPGCIEPSMPWHQPQKKKNAVAN